MPTHATLIRMNKVARLALLNAFSLWALFGASSAVDFARFIQGPPAQIGFALGADKDGYLYAVGVTDEPANFAVTPGALNAQVSVKRAMVFLQKFSPDGSQVLVSALLGETFQGNQVAAKVNASGNVYVAFTLSGNVAGSPQWQGDPTGGIAVLKVPPGGDKLEYASRVDPYSDSIELALELDSDGSTYVASGDAEQVRVWKLDPDGNLANYSHTFADMTVGGDVAYDGLCVRLAVLPDHSMFVLASPSSIYRLDSTGGSVLAHADLGERNVGLCSLTTDSGGNAYVGGSATQSYSIPSNQIGFNDPSKARLPALIVKLDSSASVVYSDVFDVANIGALTADATGKVWAGGTSTNGFAIFQLDSAGAQFLHYFSLTAPFPVNQLNNIALDFQGRPLAAGSTPALGFPAFNRWQFSAGENDPNLNAFFMRVNASPPQTALQLGVTISPTPAVDYQILTYNVQITNSGTVPANDVLLQMPDYLRDDLGVLSCHASGQGICGYSTWIASFPQIESGASATVVLRFSSGPSTSGPGTPLGVRSSTDNPNQLNAHREPNVTILPSAFTISTDFGFPLGSQLPPIEVYVAGVGPVEIGCLPGTGTCLNALPISAGSSGRVYVPTPILDGSTYYEFAMWSDGSTDNPRTFPAGTASAKIVMRKMTEPWVDPDAGIVQSASYGVGAVSPGEILTLEGANLGPSTLQTAQLDSQGRIATEVGGFQVLFDNVPAPIVYTSATQSAVIVPYSVAGKQTVQMAMQYQQQSSNPIAVDVTAAAPGLFTANSAGTGIVAAYNSNNSLNTRGSPVSRGDVVVFFATGEGLTNPTPPDGQIAGSTPPAPTLPVTVSIGGQPAEVIYSGGVPGFTAGLMQLNVRVPQSVEPGLLPVIVNVGSFPSQLGVTLAVQ
jgi:uncharacterized protein (TIGR03437 family)